MLYTLAKQYVEELEATYRYHPTRGTLEFDDGTVYTTREALILAKGGCKGEDLKAVHAVKKIFDGEVITAKEESDYLLFH